MLTILQVFFVICCLVMILVVLMQRSEGDGVAGMLGGDSGGAIFGTKTVNVLARFTAGLGAFMLVLIIVLSKMSSSETSLMDDLDVAPVAPAKEMAEGSSTKGDTKVDEAINTTAKAAESVKTDELTKAVDTATKAATTVVAPAAEPDIDPAK